MNTHEALEKLEYFGSEIASLLDAFKKQEIEYDFSSTEDKYLSEKTNVILDSLALTEEEIRYLAAPVSMEGTIHVKDSKVYLDGLELVEHDKIECFIDGFWDDLEVTKIKSRFYLGIQPVSLINRPINARIRLTKHDKKLRMM